MFFWEKGQRASHRSMSNYSCSYCHTARLEVSPTQKKNMKAAWQVEEAGELNQSRKSLRQRRFPFTDFLLWTWKRWQKLFVDSCHEKYKVNTLLQCLDSLQACSKHSLSASLVTLLLFLSLSCPHLSIKQDESSVEEGEVNKHMLPWWWLCSEPAK